MLSSSKISSDLITRSTHWLILILFFMGTLGALRTSELEHGAEKLDMIFMHKSVGVSILVLMLFWAVWKVIMPSPAPHKTNIKNSPLRRAIGFLTILLLLAQPIVGILMTQAGGNPVAPFGFFELPEFIQANKSKATTLVEVHARLWVAIIALGFAYFAGSIKQRFLASNGSLLRSLKG